jgi:5-methylcytosine-specific restriction endonuclease McrA
MSQTPKQRPKLSAKDINLLKAALRRAFARSDYYKSIAAKNYIEHRDPKRPRCEKWSFCSTCGEVVPRWTTDLDHVQPVIPLDRLTADMDPHELMDRIFFCGDENLSTVCTPCHTKKSSQENKIRRENKKRAKAAK